MKLQREVICSLAAGLVVGGLVGYLVTNARLKKVYADIADSEINSVKERYKVLHDNDGETTREYVIKTYEDDLARLGYIPSEDAPFGALPLANEGDEFTVSMPDEDVPENPTLFTHNGRDYPQTVEEHKARLIALGLRAMQPDAVDEERDTDEPDPDEDDGDEPYPTEPDKIRDPQQPYVISVGEFMDDDPVHDKITITYFEDDDTLCDEREEVIPDILNTIGIECLTMFGHLSDDPSIVYVRSERIATDFEVICDKRSYSDVVLDMRPVKERPRKFKEED